jgi:hypothetical protein
MSDDSDDDLNMDLLARAAENEDNAHILNLTADAVDAAKTSILQDMVSDEIARQDILEKLEGYVYIDEIHEVRSGTYIRWLNVGDDDDITLAKGGIFCDVRFSDYGAVLRCKTFRNRYYEVKMDNVILFRKLTPQERVLMCALTYLNS